MQIYEFYKNILTMNYPPERLADPSGILFLDIETTGLSPQKAEVFLIGTAALSEDRLYVRQFFAEDLSEERDILEAFARYVREFDTIITFNGNKFDIPFLEKRSFIYGIDPAFSEKAGIDIYKRIQPYKKLLGVPDMKQKTLERFIGLLRQDQKSGREMISLYGNYISSRNQVCQDLLLRHNQDDLTGLFDLLPLLSYPDVLNGEIKAERVVKNNYRDYEGQLKTEIIIEFTYPVPVPTPVSCGFSDCYLMLGGSRGKIRVAVFTGILRYFYPDNKTFYYIPLEDRSMRGRQGGAEGNREQQRPENCFVRVRSQFLPQWETIVTPVFKYAYEDRTMYFELTDKIKDDPEVFRRYAGHLMNMILKEL